MQNVVRARIFQIIVGRFGFQLEVNEVLRRAEKCRPDGNALNSLPVALLAAGAAAVGVGWLPSAAAAIGALPVVAGFLVNAIRQATNAPGWVVNLSPWTHLAAVPDTPPNWAATAIFLLIGAILTGLGVYGYVQRDLAT